jgi:hypothetical protein
VETAVKEERLLAISYQLSAVSFWLTNLKSGSDDMLSGVSLNMYDPPYAVWSLWRDCGWLEKLVLMLLGGLITYSLLAAIVTIVRIHSLKTPKPLVRADPESSLKALQRHWNHIGQATHAAFYLFGLVLFLVLQNVAMIPGDGGPGWAANRVLQNFILSCAFAANAFLGFLTVHMIRWFISTRISTGLDALLDPKARAES